MRKPRICLQRWGLGWMRGLVMQWETATGRTCRLAVEGADAVGADADDADGDLELAFEEVEVGN